MSEELTKKDWQDTEKQFELLIRNGKVNLETYYVALKKVREEIAKFPEEKKDDDPMPDGVKELADAIK